MPDDIIPVVHAAIPHYWLYDKETQALECFESREDAEDFAAFYNSRTYEGRCVVVRLGILDYADGLCE